MPVYLYREFWLLILPGKCLPGNFCPSTPCIAAHRLPQHNSYSHRRSLVILGAAGIRGRSPPPPVYELPSGIRSNHVTKYFPSCMLGEFSGSCQ